MSGSDMRKIMESINEGTSMSGEIAIDKSWTNVEMAAKRLRGAINKFRREIEKEQEYMSEDQIMHWSYADGICDSILSTLNDEGLD